MKILKKLLSYLASPFSLGLAVTLFMVYASFDYYSSRHLIQKGEQNLSSLIQLLHEKTIDWRLVDRGQKPPSDRVAILAIDETSIEQEGRWPWPREKQAKMVEKAMGFGAKVIAFDIIYSEEDPNASIPTLRKLRRDLKDIQQINAQIEEKLESEIIRNDSDKIFSNAVRENAESLVLGAYFEPAPHDALSPAWIDYCHDALFERSAESRYWKKEFAPTNVIDQSLIRTKFPTAMKEHLTNYFAVLEVSGSTAWFSNHPEIQSRLGFAIDDIFPGMPVEAYPILATLWLNNDWEMTKDLLEQLNPELATPEKAKELLYRFGTAFDKRDAASLLSAIKQEGAEYCANRFFKEQDELLHLDEYKKIWGDSQDSVEQFKTLHSWNIPWEVIQSALKANEKESLDSAIARFKKESLRNSISEVERWWVNIPLIADATKHTGFFNAKQDSDGSIRRGPLLVRRGNAYMMPISLKSFLIDKGLSAVASIDNETSGARSEKVLRSLDIIDTEGKKIMNVPVDHQASLMINYAGARNMFPHVTAGDLFSENPKMRIEKQEFDKESGRWIKKGHWVDKATFMKDKILIAGATATGVYDLRVTPFDENFPGIETHANILSNLLVEFARIKGDPVPADSPGFLRTHPEEGKLMSLSLLSMGIVLSTLLAYFGSVVGLSITATALASVYGIDKFILFKSGIVVTIVFPILLIIGNFVTLTFFKYFTEERKKRELKGTFEKYVSPAIVAEVLSDPEKIELGGRKVELTVMFSDVRGFTTISEKLDPRELSNLLNSYLTPMTNLVFKNKGTLDKYMGDAIMAFWGAPLHFDDHAAHACRCALQMIDKLKELQIQYEQRGLPAIDIGIGLNTGEMSVGNMGSDTVRSYTVMGDAVNLGSRLEGINKQYGTRIIISEFTQAAIKDQFLTREVDWVRVKGKAQPVRIFELIKEGPAEGLTIDFLKNFNEGFHHYHSREFQTGIESFKKALGLLPDDAVSQLYIERCQDYLKEPPPPDWDGVYTMTSK